MQAQYRIISFMQLHFGDFYSTVIVRGVKFVNSNTLRVAYDVEGYVDDDSETHYSHRHETHIAVLGDQFYKVS